MSVNATGSMMAGPLAKGVPVFAHLPAGCRGQVSVWAVTLITFTRSSRVWGRLIDTYLRWPGAELLHGAQQGPKSGAGMAGGRAAPLV